MKFPCRIVVIMLSFLASIAGANGDKIEINKIELIIARNAENLPIILTAEEKMRFFNSPVFCLNIQQILVDGKKVKGEATDIFDPDMSLEKTERSWKLVSLKKSLILAAQYIDYDKKGEMFNYSLMAYDVSHAKDTIKIYYHAAGGPGDRSGNISQITYQLVDFK